MTLPTLPYSYSPQRQVSGLTIPPLPPTLCLDSGSSRGDTSTGTPRVLHSPKGVTPACSPATLSGCWCSSALRRGLGGLRVLGCPHSCRCGTAGNHCSSLPAGVGALGVAASVCLGHSHWTTERTRRLSPLSALRRLLPRLPGLPGRHRGPCAALLHCCHQGILPLGEEGRSEDDHRDQDEEHHPPVHQSSLRRPRRPAKAMHPSQVSRMATSTSIIRAPPPTRAPPAGSGPCSRGTPAAETGLRRSGGWAPHQGRHPGCRASGPSRCRRPPSGCGA